MQGQRYFFYRYFTGPLVLGLLSATLVPPALSASFLQTSAKQTAATTDPPTGLKILMQQGVEIAGPTAARYAFGTVDPLTRAHLEHTFLLRNNGPHPVSIDHLQSSCGCTGVFWTIDGKPSVPLLRVGRRVAIHVTFDTTYASPGPTEKYVWVYGKGKNVPALFTLEVTATIQNVVAFSQPLLPFGRVAAGTQPSLPLTATLDARLLSLGDPKLICSNPDMQIRSVGREESENASTKAQVVRHYNITLSPQARLGVVTGTLSFSLAPSTLRHTQNGAGIQATSARPQAIIPAGMTSVTVSLTGEVVGRIAAMPGTVLFGTLFPAQSATQQINIVGESEEALKNLKVSCPIPWLSVSLHRSLPEEAQTAPPKRILSITCGANAPSGTLETQILVTTERGECLVIPVFAYVAGAAKP